MVRRNRTAAAAPLSNTVKQQLAQNLQPIRKDEAVLYRSNERDPLVSVRSPALGHLTSHAVRLIGDCMEKRRQESRQPQALRAFKGAVPGFVIMEPVTLWDPTALDQYELNWYRGNRRATVDLRPILQPRNLEVPPGYVAEMPVSLEELPNSGWFILLHSGDAVVRLEGDVDRIPPDDLDDEDELAEEKLEAETAAGKQDP